MKDLIEEWEKSAEKYQSLGRSATDPIRQEGLLCRSEVYSYCADKLRRASQPCAEDGRAKDTHCAMCKIMKSANELLIELDKNLRCVHPDMGGNHKYMVTLKTQPVLREIKEYVQNLRASQLCAVGGRVAGCDKCQDWYKTRDAKCGNCGQRLVVQDRDRNRGLI